jgi:hypothetical protein
MPGPVSDSYDPEFGTGDNATAVRDGLAPIVAAIEQRLGPKLKDIVAVARSRNGKPYRGMPFSERELRLIRFACLRAMDTI